MIGIRTAGVFASSQCATSDPPLAGRPRFHGAGQVSCVVLGKWGDLYQNHELGISLGCPAPFPTAAIVRLDNTGMVSVNPREFAEARRLVEIVLRTYAPPGMGAQVEITSIQQDGCQPPTCTWSMLAAAKATFALLDIPPDRSFLADQTAKIESRARAIGLSDGRMVIWDSQRGTYLSGEHPVPRAGFIGAVLLDRRFPTANLHQVHPTYTPAERQAFARMSIALEGVLAAGFVEALGDFASTSTEINARYIPLTEIEFLRSLKRLKAIHGYFGAHSGACFGVICDPNPDRVESIFAEFHRLGPGYRIVAWTNDAFRALSPTTAPLIDIITS